MDMKRLSCIATIILLASMLIPVAIASEETITMHFFYGDGCPHCETQKSYNQQLLDDHPTLEIISYEVYSNRTNQQLFAEMAREYGASASGVPTTFIEGRYWTGFSEPRYLEMDAHITEISAQHAGPEPRPSPDNNIITLPFIGDVDLSQSSLLVTTLIISFIDGFNPCSLWLLTFLLGILLLTKSRRKMIIVGGTFLIVTATAYGAFIAGLFSVFSYTSMISEIRYVVATIAFIFAAVNIKDYFWYKKGISFTISDDHKPGLFKKMRGILRPGQSTYQMVLGTAILALGVTLVELPCTAGFPTTWSTLVALQSPSIIEFVTLLGIYLLVYLSIEIIILVTAIITLNKIVFTEDHGRILKLFGGAIMLSFAYGFAFDYASMESLSGMLSLVFISLAIAGVVYAASKILPSLSGKRPPARQEEPNTRASTPEKDDEKTDALETGAGSAHMNDENKEERS